MVLGSSEMVLLLFSVSTLLLLLLFESSSPRLLNGFIFLCEIRWGFFKEVDIDVGGVDDTDVIPDEEEVLSGTI